MNPQNCFSLYFCSNIKTRASARTFHIWREKKSIKNVGNFDFHPAERALVFGETLQSLQTRTGTFPGEEAFVIEFHRVGCYTFN